jgi:hypothetical protein
VGFVSTHPCDKERRMDGAQFHFPWVGNGGGELKRNGNLAPALRDGNSFGNPDPGSTRGYYRLLPPGEAAGEQEVSCLRGSATPLDDCYKGLSAGFFSKL